MGKFRIEITDLAKSQLAKHYKSGNKGTIKKIEKILIELSKTSLHSIGKPEALKENLTGFWSRQINLKDRIIYTVDNHLVVVDVVSVMGHYSDK